MPKTAVSEGHKRFSEALQQSLRRCEVLEGLEGLEAFDGAKQQFRKGIQGAAAVSEALRGFGRVGSVWGCQTAVSEGNINKRLSKASFGKA